MKKKVLVTGGEGLVGTALKEVADERYDFVFCNRSHGDLRLREQVAKLYEDHKPNYVIHAAARVGGIGGNMASHGEFFYENLLMNAHMVHYAYLSGVEKFLGFSSVCVFPHDAAELTEDLMLDGQPFHANFAYGWAKRLLDIQISAYKKQYRIKNYCSVIPGNLFGPRDLYNLQGGHVLPCLMHKLFLAKRDGTPLRVWGDGSSVREFIFSTDMARIVYRILELEEIPQRVIVSGDRSYTIRQIVELLCKAADFGGEVIWETDKPNGQRARPTDLGLLRSLVGDLNFTDMGRALGESYKWFESNYPNVRL